MSVQLESHPNGAILPVRATAGARQTKLLGTQGGALKLSVTQAPEKGKANKAIVALLSKALGLRKSQLELLSGATSPQKRFLVQDESVEELARKIKEKVG